MTRGWLAGSQWADALVAYLTEKRMQSNFLWCLNADSSTTGLLQKDWTTPDPAKLELLARLTPAPTAFSFSQQRAHEPRARGLKTEDAAAAGISSQPFVSGADGYKVFRIPSMLALGNGGRMLPDAGSHLIARALIAAAFPALWRVLLLIRTAWKGAASTVM